MADHTFFARADVLGRLSEAAEKFVLHPAAPRLYRLGIMLRIIASNATEYDKHCPMGVEKLSAQFTTELSNVQHVTENSAFDMLTALVYRVLAEYDISTQNELSEDARHFTNQVESDYPTMGVEAKEHIEYSQRILPTGILKRTLNSGEFGNLRNVSSVAASVNSRIDEWESKLLQAKVTAERLGTLLESQTAAFNFVGLHEGFADLAEKITKELRQAKMNMRIFGCLIVLPGLLEFWFISRDPTVGKNALLLAATSVASLTLTLLLLYFFRIALRSADSCRAQLMQVRLRMSLCKFIQNYADYSKGIREHNPDALSKFESLIFSGIVGTEDKLPSTFDGIDQLSALARSFRGDRN